MATSLGLIPLWAGPAQQTDKSQALAREEADDYFKRWLDSDVAYLITDEERDVFAALGTADEKEQFIEQFWFRRDPDPMTSVNEYKEEHYRRIAYANEHFGSGLPGWLTDRGRIYIIHGPPAEIESHPSGGQYSRPAHEGGGNTSTFPFEIWRYRFIEGIGTDVELEFVDPSLTNEYRLALNPEEKDALLYMPGGGPTLAEQLGLAQKADRPFFSPGNRSRYPLLHERAKDNPFSRYETYSLVQKPVEIKYQDLKQAVQVQVGYESLPLTLQESFFRINDNQMLVPITVMIRNKDLSFEREGDTRIARLAIYGVVTSITNRVILEFEDDLAAGYPLEAFNQGLKRHSVYQKIVALDPKLRYKVDLVVKDKASRKVGVVRKALLPPSFASRDLTASSLVLSDLIQILHRAPEQDEMFVLGDVKVRPNPGGEFQADRPLGIYLQLYGAALDQTTLQPSLSVTYRILQGDRVVKELPDLHVEPIQYFSADRVVLVNWVPLDGLEAGRYRVEVAAEDLLTQRSVKVEGRFSIAP